MTDASEYHSGSGSKKTDTKYVQSLKENWKQMEMQIGELDIHAEPAFGDV